MEEEKKRLFFAAEIAAPWPKDLPKARFIEASSRHLTLAFLGSVSFPALQKILPTIPCPSFEIGLVGISDKLLFLPKHEPRVIASHVKWLSNKDRLLSFHHELIRWLVAHHYSIKDRELLSHVSIARAPFSLKDWEKTMMDLPFVLKAFHLYESTGHLTYVPLWSYDLLLPFEELEHTADLAFHIRSKSVEQLHLHAQIALAFKFPSLLPYLITDVLQDSLDDIIIKLNESIAKADQEIGCPLKAVSFHGKIHVDENQILHWEMIIDV